MCSKVNKVRRKFLTLIRVEYEMSRALKKFKDWLFTWKWSGKFEFEKELNLVKIWTKLDCLDPIVSGSSNFLNTDTRRCFLQCLRVSVQEKEVFFRLTTFFSGTKKIFSRNNFCSLFYVL